MTQMNAEKKENYLNFNFCISSAFICVICGSMLLREKPAAVEEVP